LRLPIADGQRRYVSNHPGLIHTAFLHGSDLPSTAEERQRLWAYAWLIRAEAYRAIYANPRIRNPVAYAVANQTAVAYEDLTGRQMTSVTDPYREGYPEVGKFARLVGEIFAILAIDASPAGHVKRLINQRKCARGLSFD
jgi:hypothetical protein